jgi:hypothetical protein
VKERGNLGVALWGSLGFVALLGQATYRLFPYAREVVETGMTTGQWALMVGYALFMAYSEGYKGFHKQASPRVVERSFYLARNPTLMGVVLAPFFAMGLFGATRKRLIVGWAIVLMIVGLIILVRMLSQPWRGIVDAGVVLGLAMGATSTLYFLIRALAGQLPGVDPEVSG